MKNLWTVSGPGATPVSIHNSRLANLRFAPI
jgi:hypothetical protein